MIGRAGTTGFALGNVFRTAGLQKKTNRNQLGTSSTIQVGLIVVMRLFNSFWFNDANRRKR